MLTPEEKEELLKDARAIKSGKRTPVKRDREQKEALSLDDYIHFLNAIQTAFGPFKIALQKTIAKNCKL